jgi:tight adherence protein B
MLLAQLIIGGLVFGGCLLLLPKIMGGKGTAYTKRSLQDITRNTQSVFNEAGQVLIEEKTNKASEIFSQLPLFSWVYSKYKISALNTEFWVYSVFLIVLFLVSSIYAAHTFNGIWWIGLGCGIVACFVFVQAHLGSRIAKNEDYYLNNFPDAIDMIVRSVKSGQPLMSALNLIVQNSNPPISTEIKRVLDEVAYGRPLPVALRNMAERVGFIDINFFVVILSVQQETGGSLADILTNLSGIIRKRKQLRLKVKALTAQGRLTTWIFAAIPLLMLVVVNFIKPGYLDPFFNNPVGVAMFWIGMGFIVFSILIARKISNLEV